MGQTEPTRQSDEILPPIMGSILVLGASSSILVVDLTTWPQTAALPQSTVQGSERLNPLGQYVSLCVDGGSSSVYAAFASTSALAATAITSASTTVNASTGAITVAGTEMVPLVPNAVYSFRMPPGPSSDTTKSGGAVVPWGTLSSARYLALLMKTGAGTANVVAFVSSR